MFLLKPTWGLASNALKAAFNVRRKEQVHGPTDLNGADPGSQREDMDVINRTGLDVISERNTSSVFLPAGNPSDATGASQKVNTEGLATPPPSSRPKWHESCTTTVNGSDSGLPDTAEQKPPRLLPYPEEFEEIDEIISEDAPAMSLPPSPLPRETFQRDDDRPFRYRRRLGESLHKLEDDCKSVVGIRLKAHELRGSIRRERQALIDIEARFMQELRNLILRSPSEKFKPLTDLYEQMDSRRNLLFPKEDDYNILEDQMNSREFDLEETGRDVLKLLEGARTSVFGDPDVGSLLEDNADLESVTSYGNETLRPGLREYLSLIGDRDLVEARLSDLQQERAKLVEQEKSRIRVGLVLNEASRKFLDEFDANHTFLRDDLALVERDIDRMRRTLESSNRTFFSSTQFDDTGTASEPFPDVFPPRSHDSSTGSDVTPLQSSTALERDRTPPILEAVKSDRAHQEPLLLTEQEITATYPRVANTEARPLRYINTWLSVEENLSCGEFIDDWLLNKLRNSRSEIYQYKREPVLQMVHVSEEELKKLVLEWWWSDDAAGDYLKTRKVGSQRLSSSPQGVTSSRGVQSDTVLVRMNQLASRLYRDHAALQVSKTQLKLTIRRSRST